MVGDWHRNFKALDWPGSLFFLVFLQKHLADVAQQLQIFVMDTDGVDLSGWRRVYKGAPL